MKQGCLFFQFYSINCLRFSATAIRQEQDKRSINRRNYSYLQTEVQSIRNPGADEMSRGQRPLLPGSPMGRWEAQTGGAPEASLPSTVGKTNKKPPYNIIKSFFWLIKSDTFYSS